MVDWRLRGRDVELARLIALMEDPNASGVLLSGAPGVGKTRLGLECLAAARERGFPVERISPTFATSTLPLGAVILNWPSELNRSASPLEQAELVHRIASELVRKAGGQRLILLVDDVNWLDQLTAVMVHQLVVGGSAFVVLTARTGSSAPDPIVALWKDNIVERVTVAAIARDVIEPLLVEVLGGPVAGAAVATLAERSEGNLLYLREQILAHLEDGSLTQDAGVWQLTKGPGAPPRLVELIELRLAGLPQDERTCLEIVAFGEPLEFADVLTLMGEDLAQRLELKGLVSVRSDDWGGVKVTLAHPLIGEVLRAQATVVRAHQVTGMLAATVERRGAALADDLLRVATWRLVCGGGDPKLMHEAAVAAFARRDYDLTLRLAQAAIAAGSGFTTRLLHAEANGIAGRRDVAESELAALAGEADSPAERATVARARMVNAHLGADVALGLQVYRDALSSISDPHWQADLTAHRAWHVIMQDGPRAALRASEEVDPAALLGSVLVTTAMTRTCAYARSGRVTDALAWSERGRRAQEEMTEPFDLHVLAHHFLACEALATAGRWAEWHSLAEACYRAAVEERSSEMQLWFAIQFAKVSLAQGQVRTAIRLAGEAVGIAHQLNDVIQLQTSLATLVEAHALVHEVSAAERALAELDSMQQSPWLFSEPGLARAWLMVSKGDLVSARRHFEAEAERGLACDDLRAASLALHALVRIGDARLVGERLHEIADRVEGDLVPAQARHARAAARQDGPGLEKVAADFLELTGTLLAAEAYCDATMAYRMTDSAKQATGAARQATLLLDQCEGALTPASQLLVERPRLTQAERRTALLAAHGRSNRDIAATEQVSVRTVEYRLQGVYDKLGISSRRALADALGADTDTTGA